MARKECKPTRFLPAFSQISAISIKDSVTGREIPVVFGLSAGSVWRKFGSKAWENITTEEFFIKREEDIQVEK